MRTLLPARLECKTEADDKELLVAATVSAIAENKNIQSQSVLHGASAPPHLVTSVESPVRFSLSVSVPTSAVKLDYTCPQARAIVNSDLVSDVKDTRVVRDGDAVRVAISDAPPVRSVDSRSVHLAGSDVPAFDSSQRVRWLSGVSCTSSSTSGGEESPQTSSSTKNCMPNTNTSLSEWFSSSRPSLFQGLTSTPVNGWLDLTSTPSRSVLKEDGDIGQLDKLSASTDVHGSLLDGISFHKSPNNSKAAVSLGSISAMERLYHPGIGRIPDNRPWLSSNVSPESRWNSKISLPVPEPFWSSRTAPIQPQMTTIQPGSVFDVSQTPPSFNGSFGDVTNNMHMAQNISPSTPLAAPPSKKRVCVIALKHVFL